jgi:hypothetical protein
MSSSGLWWADDDGRKGEVIIYYSVPNTTQDGLFVIVQDCDVIKTQLCNFVVY